MSDKGARYWADKHELHTDRAEEWLQMPPDPGTLAAAQAHAILANAAATRLMVEAYDGHNTPSPL